MTAIIDTLPALRAKIFSYCLMVVYNADKSGLFYKPAADRTLALSRSKDQKKAKDRISILVCVSADGSDKVEPLFIGKSLQSRVFKKNSAQDYRLIYRFSKRARMTVKMFLIGQCDLIAA